MGEYDFYSGALRLNLFRKPGGYIHSKRFLVTLPVTADGTGVGSAMSGIDNHGVQPKVLGLRREDRDKDGQEQVNCVFQKNCVTFVIRKFNKNIIN